MLCPLSQNSAGRPCRMKVHENSVISCEMVMYNSSIGPGTGSAEVWPPTLICTILDYVFYLISGWHGCYRETQRASGISVYSVQRMVRVMCGELRTGDVGWWLWWWSWWSWWWSWWWPWWETRERIPSVVIASWRNSKG